MTITQAQNEPRQLERLAAQRQLYSDAKRLQIWHIALSIPAVIIWTVVVAFRPELKVWAGLWGITVTLLDLLFFAPRQKKLKGEAARVQEVFDCDVLELSWNSRCSGRRPDPETVAEAAGRHECSDPGFAKLKDWYPASVERLPHAVGRLVCQRASCWWDAQLRRRYSAWVIAIVATLVVSVFTASLYGGLTLEKFVLAAVLPLMPVVVLAIRQVRENFEAADRADDLKREADDLWGKAISTTMTPDKLTAESRHLQDSIHEHRRQSPLVLDWIYGLLQRDQEVQMNKGAHVLVDEAVAALGKRSRSATASGKF